MSVVCLYVPMKASHVQKRAWSTEGCSTLSHISRQEDIQEKIRQSNVEELTR